MKKIISENIFYTLTNSKVCKKATCILTLTEKGLEKIKKSFNTGTNSATHNKSYRGDRCSWTLHYYKKHSKEMYGVSGDSSFGNFPFYYQTRYSGNKREAKIVFEQFIKEYFTYYIDISNI